MLRVAADTTRCRDAFFAALVTRDSTRARSIVEAAVDAGTPVSAVYVDVLQPSLYAIGEEWARGRMTVAEEHYATAMVEQLVGRLAARTRMPPFGGRLAIVTGTPGEQHAVGSRMVADFLESDGWEVLHLGASTPSDALVELVEAEEPDVVALSSCATERPARVAEVIERLAACRPQPLVAVGGQFWTEERAVFARELGAEVVTGDARSWVTGLRDVIPPRTE